MKKFIALLFACLLALTGCGGSTVKIGAADKAGTYYALGESFSKILGDAGISAQVKETAGSAANIRLMEGGYVKLAIVQNDLLTEAASGKGDYAGSPAEKVRAVAALYTEHCFIVASADSGIEDSDGLAGAAISVGEEESGSERSAERVLKASGIDESLVTRKNMRYDEAAAALESGEIDAAFVTIRRLPESMEKLVEEGKAKLIPLSERTAENIESIAPYISVEGISADGSGESGDIKAIGIKSVLAASSDLDGATVHKAAAALFEKAAGEEAFAEAGFAGDAEEACKGVYVPFHEGAVSYYESVGVNPDEAVD